MPKADSQVEQLMQVAEKTAEATTRAHELANESGAGKVETLWGPNATRFKAKPFVEMMTRMNRNQYAIFTDNDALMKVLKNPEPGYHYHWARHPQYEPSTGLRVAMGLYKYVQPNEIKGDAFAIFANHKGTSGNMVCFGTLVLVKESPEAWQETHVAPQVEGFARMARQEESFQSDVEEESKGRAQGTVERVFEKDEQS